MRPCSRKGFTRRWSSDGPEPYAALAAEEMQADVGFLGG